MRKGDFLFFASFIINQHVHHFLFLTRDLTNYYVCQNALRLSKCITSVKMHYGYVNSDLALLPYISAFYKSNSRRSIHVIFGVLLKWKVSWLLQFIILIQNGNYVIL